MNFTVEAYLPAPIALPPTLSDMSTTPAGSYDPLPGEAWFNKKAPPKAGLSDDF